LRFSSCVSFAVCPITQFIRPWFRSRARPM
jgi:hypothetical protein